MHRPIAASVALLAVALLAVAAPTSGISWPAAPAGAIVAVATIAPSVANVTARGNAVLIAVKTGDAYVAVNLTSALADITMAHIHVTNATANNPVVLGLLPRAPGRLDPPLSYRGTFSFVTKFNITQLPTGVSTDAFLAALSSELLYVNVHTIAFPGGAIRGTLRCKPPCRFT